MQNHEFILFSWRFHMLDENKLIFVGGYTKDTPEERSLEVYLDDELLDFNYKTTRGIQVYRKYQMYPDVIYEEVIGEVSLPSNWTKKKKFQIKSIIGDGKKEYITYACKVAIDALIDGKNEILHAIDKVIEEDKKLVIEGWATDKDDVDIRIYNVGTEVDYKLIRKERRDVARIFTETEIDPYIGFEIIVENVKLKDLTIVFKTEKKTTEQKLKDVNKKPFVSPFLIVSHYLKRHGLKKTVRRIIYKLTHMERFNDVRKPLEYELWIKEVESNETYDEKFLYNPKISIVVPVFNVLDKHLIPCIESVLAQVYDNWELCLADDKSTWKNVGETLAKYENHEKIKVVYRQENGHISRCTNSAIEVATGEYIAFMDCDDVLRPNALYEVVKLLNENPELDFIYSDEDKIDDDGKNRHMPHFKPDWSPDTLMSHMYTCHFGVYRRSIVNEIGGLRPGVEGSQDYDFTLRFTEKTNKIAHISKILYHWRERAESTAINPGAKPYILEAAKKTKLDALERRGLKAELELIDIMYQYRVNYISQTNPLISIIIPSKDNFDILKRCIESLVTITEYKNYEIVLVDNGSNDDNKAKYTELAVKYNINYYYDKMEFNFSKMCNIGAQKAKGSYLLFLNDDIEILHGDWLSRMVGHAELDHIGAVGAKLLYPGGDMIQHAGVLEIANGPVHAFIGCSDENLYYFGRTRLDYNWLAVTAACLLINKEKFNQIGGFDENLAVAYNDIDLCFKLVEAGYYNVVRNDVKLYHHESVSRGDDLVDEAKFERLMNEQKKLYAKHPRFDKKDPFYNINLTQHDVTFDYNYDMLLNLEKGN